MSVYTNKINSKHNFKSEFSYVGSCLANMVTKLVYFNTLCNRKSSIIQPANYKGQKLELRFLF